jgi:PAS domain-containing protein
MSIPLFAEVHDDDLHSRLRNPAASFALTLWLMSQGSRSYPEEATLREAGIDRFGGDLMILRPLPGDDWFYEHYGARIAQDAGFDMTGRRVSDFHGVLSTFFRDIYARAVRERRPIATLHRYGHYRERPLWERLVLPVATDGVLSGLYVINRVREIDQDLSYIKTRARENGLIVLQFRRDKTGHVAEAVIVSANKAAREMTGRRLDELVEQPICAMFPDLAGTALWRRYLEVAETRQPQQLFATCGADGLVGEFDVLISPFVDGVTIDFARLAPISLAG